jgi:putative Ca2+/H+ antiporter (TMEM165/GDT1 family)
MESLLITFLSVLLAECGDRPQLLSAAFAERFGRNRPVMFALALATLLNCVLAAIAGSQITGLISEDPVRLFMGLAYISGGIAMLSWRRSVNLLEKWKTGPFLTAFLGIFILQFGDKGQFIVLANAANGEAWWLSAIGGWLGAMLAIVPAIILKEKLAQLLPISSIRKMGGIMFLLYGAFLALRAWHLL